MTNIILRPPHEEVAKWGPLAHVTKEERERILNLPFGEFKPAVKRPERAKAEARKKAKAGR